MGNQKAVGRARRARKPSMSRDITESNRGDEPGRLSRDPTNNARDIISNRRSRDAKDEISNGAVNSSKAQAAKKKRGEKKKPGQPRMKPNKPRKLNRWSPYLDQRLVLIMVYELKRQGVEIPYSQIAHRLAKERDSTGEAIKQHLDKMRLRMLNQGCWVPPLSGRASCKKGSDIRGIIHKRDEVGDIVERELRWEDDFSGYHEPENKNWEGVGEIIAGVAPERLNPTGRSAEEQQVKKDQRHYPRNRRKFNSDKLNDVSGSVSGDDDEEYHPSVREKVKSVARNRNRTKAKKNADESENESEREIEYESDSLSEDDDGDARMMDFFQPAEEIYAVRKIAALLIQPSSLARFPAGISGPGSDMYDPKDVVHAPQELCRPIQVVQAPQELHKPNQVVQVPQEMYKSSQVAQAPREMYKSNQVAQTPERLYKPSQIAQTPERLYKPNQVALAPEGTFGAILLPEHLDRSRASNYLYSFQDDPRIPTKPDLIPAYDTFQITGAGSTTFKPGPPRASMYTRDKILAEANLGVHMNQGGIRENIQHNTTVMPSYVHQYENFKYNSATYDGVGQTNSYKGGSFSHGFLEQPKFPDPREHAAAYYSPHLKAEGYGILPSGPVGNWFGSDNMQGDLEISNDIDMVAGSNEINGDYYQGGIDSTGNFAGYHANQHTADDNIEPNAQYFDVDPRFEDINMGKNLEEYSIDLDLEGFNFDTPDSNVSVYRTNTTEASQRGNEYATQYQQTSTSLGADIDILTDDEAVTEDQVQSVASRYPNCATVMNRWAGPTQNRGWEEGGI